MNRSSGQVGIPVRWPVKAEHYREAAPVASPRLKRD
jgi:hypothetical protein